MHGTAIIIVHAGWLAGVVDAWYSNYHRACWLAGATDREVTAEVLQQR